MQTNVVGESLASRRDVPAGETAGAALAVCAAATLLAISHHPVAHGRHVAAVLPEIVRLATLDRIVHGAVIVLVLMSLYAFAVFALRRGIERQASVFGLIAYAAGSAALVAAGLIDGFVLSDVGEYYAAQGPAGLQPAAAALTLCSIAVQVLTQMGFLTMAAGALAWSLELVREPGALHAVAVVGLVSALLTIGLSVANAGSLNPQNLLAIVACQALWSFAVAALLLKRRV
jgi:hypothetical protein